MSTVILPRPWVPLFGRIFTPGKLSNWGFPALSSDPYFQTGFEIGFGNLSNRGSGFEIGFGNLSNRGSTWSHHLETSVKPLPKFPVAHQKWGGSLQKWPGCTQVWFVQKIYLQIYRAPSISGIRLFGLYKWPQKVTKVTKLLLQNYNIVNSKSSSAKKIWKCFNVTQFKLRFQSFRKVPKSFKKS